MDPSRPAADRMVDRRLVALATLGSALTLGGALGFQFIGGIAPCHLCLLQRWPHLAAIVIGLVTLLVPRRLLCWLGALATLITAGLGFYHTGVERGWWEGPSTCTSNGVSGLSANDLMDQIMNAPLVQCDQVAWSMFGLSMASWNVVVSLILTVIWLLAARR